MMTWLFSAMVVIGVILGAINGRMPAVSDAALSESKRAVELVFNLLGVLCMWCGVMRIAEKSGLTNKLCRFFAPAMKLLFKGLDMSSPAAQAISMNITANLLGLGNAVTPLGMRAMQELEKLSPDPRFATDHMAMLVVLNTASLQLIPTNTAAMRLLHGSAAPFEILPAVWVASIISLTCGIIMVRILSRFFSPRKKL